jgi:hypothetical protein
MREQARECAADAYALIRHYQKYGQDSAFGQYIKDMRVFDIVHHGDHTHYTIESLDAVMEMAKDGRLENLTPAQARDLAAKIAFETAHDWKIDKVLSSTFEPAVSLLEKKDPEQVADKLLDTVASIGAETACPAVQKTCVLYVEALERCMPAGKLDIQQLHAARQAIDKNSFDHVGSLKTRWNKVRWKATQISMDRAAKPALH